MIGKKLMVGFTSIYTHRKNDTLTWGSPWRGRLSRIDGFVLGDSKNDNLHELEYWRKNEEDS
jgi:hypothetical protein